MSSDRLILYPIAYTSDPHPIEESLKTIVESEGVRVSVNRNAANRTVQVMTMIPAPKAHRIFEITDAAIENAETSAMVHHVVDRIREFARSMRAEIVCEMVGKGIALDDEKTRGEVVEAITKHADSATCERLALELMAHVERLGK